jgi:formylglycine-generating enzyme required for sulfatase activity
LLNTSGMSDIFICYSRTDSVIANKLADQLRTEGWSVFLDVQTRVGRRWHKEIEREMHAARAFVVLWSAQSRESDFVLEEAEYGKRKGILFPAFIGRVESPYGFSRIQTADLIGWTGDPSHPGLAQLLEPLRLQLNGLGTLPKPGESFRDKLKDGGEGPLMVVIPAGEFVMGSPPEEPEHRDTEGPQHPVRIARPFAMGVYAVTFDDYERFASATKCETPGDAGWGRGRRPVINVAWDDARAYCAWLSEQTAADYRLPSEAEWEYACRAGTTTPFHFGERLSTDQANFNGNYTYAGSAKGQYRGQTTPVGSFPPNAFGLHDMHGNVWEWCQNTWHGNYAGAPADGSAWETEGARSRVLRGGSWGSGPRGCRAAGRFGDAPVDRSSGIGFRVCRGAFSEPPGAAPVGTGALPR